jgi:hypothetical protein
MKRLTIGTLIFSAACATSTPKPAPATTATPAAAPAPVAVSAPVSAADLSDHWGDSALTAVTVPADAPNDGVDFENNWIFDRYGRFRRIKYGLAHDGERRYDVITVELPDSSEHTVYFDITDLWMKWKPSSPK